MTRAKLFHEKPEKLQEQPHVQQSYAPAPPPETSAADNQLKQQVKPATLMRSQTGDQSIVVGGLDSRSSGGTSGTDTHPSALPVPPLKIVDASATGSIPDAVAPSLTQASAGVDTHKAVVPAVPSKVADTGRSSSSATDVPSPLPARSVAVTSGNLDSLGSTPPSNHDNVGSAPSVVRDVAVSAASSHDIPSATPRDTAGSVQSSIRDVTGAAVLSSHDTPSAAPRDNAGFFQSSIRDVTGAAALSSHDNSSAAPLPCDNAGSLPSSMRQVASSAVSSSHDIPSASTRDNAGSLPSSVHDGTGPAPTSTRDNAGSMPSSIRDVTGSAPTSTRDNATTRDGGAVTTVLAAVSGALSVPSTIDAPNSRDTGVLPASLKDAPPYNGSLASAAGSPVTTRDVAVAPLPTAKDYSSQNAQAPQSSHDSNAGALPTAVKDLTSSSQPAGIVRDTAIPASTIAATAISSTDVLASHDNVPVSTATAPKDSATSNALPSIGRTVGDIISGVAPPSNKDSVVSKDAIQPAATSVPRDSMVSATLTAPRDSVASASSPTSADSAISAASAVPSVLTPAKESVSASGAQPGASAAGRSAGDIVIGVANPTPKDSTLPLTTPPALEVLVGKSVSDLYTATSANQAKDSITTPNAPPTKDSTTAPSVQPTKDSITTPSAQPTKDSITTPSAQPTKDSITTPSAQPTKDSITAQSVQPTKDSITTPSAQPTKDSIITSTSGAVQTKDTTVPFTTPATLNASNDAALSPAGNLAKDATVAISNQVTQKSIADILGGTGITQTKDIAILMPSPDSRGIVSKSDVGSSPSTSADSAVTLRSPERSQSDAASTDAVPSNKAGAIQTINSMSIRITEANAVSVASGNRFSEAPSGVASGDRIIRPVADNVSVSAAARTTGSSETSLSQHINVAANTQQDTSLLTTNRVFDTAVLSPVVRSALGDSVSISTTASALRNDATVQVKSTEHPGLVPGREILNAVLHEAIKSGSPDVVATRISPDVSSIRTVSNTQATRDGADAPAVRRPDDATSVRPGVEQSVRVEPVQPGRVVPGAVAARADAATARTDNADSHNSDSVTQRSLDAQVVRSGIVASTLPGVWQPAAARVNSDLVGGSSSDSPARANLDNIVRNNANAEQPAVRHVVPQRIENRQEVPGRVPDNALAAKQDLAPRINDLIAHREIKVDITPGAVPPITRIAAFPPAKEVASTRQLADISRSLGEMPFPGVRPTTEVRELPSFRNVMGISDVLKFIEKVGEQADKTEIIAKDKSGSNRNDANAVVSRRVLYTVKEGETLESIATSRLGDARYDNLIVTINRADIHHAQVGNMVVPFVYANQKIWLPSQAELAIYKRNFFGSKKRSGSASSNSHPSPITPMYETANLRAASSGYRMRQVERVRNSGPQTPVLWSDRFIAPDTETLVRQNDAPARPRQAPVQRTYALEPQTYALEPQTYALEPQTYALEPQTYALEQQTRALEPQTYALTEQTRALEPQTYVPAQRKDVLAPKFFDATPSHDGSDRRLSETLTAVRFAGNRAVVRIEKPNLTEAQISQRRCYQVRLGETLQSVALRDPVIGDVRCWTLIARMNGLSDTVDANGHPVASLVRGQYLVLPTKGEVEEFKLLNKLHLAVSKRTNLFAEKAQNQFDAMHASAQHDGSNGPHTSVEDLSEFCKLVISRRSDTAAGTMLSIRLQAWIMSDWHTVATYDCTPQSSTRTIAHKDGKVELLRIDLPPEIAEQMATEDLRRNWHLYYNSYFILKHAETVNPGLNIPLGV